MFQILEFELSEQEDFSFVERGLGFSFVGDGFLGFGKYYCQVLGFLWDVSYQQEQLISSSYYGGVGVVEIWSCYSFYFVGMEDDEGMGEEFSFFWGCLCLVFFNFWVVQCYGCEFWRMSDEFVDFFKKGFFCLKSVGIVMQMW